MEGRSYDSSRFMESRSNDSSRLNSRNSYSSSSEISGLTWDDWLRTNPWIVRGGLSSGDEVREAYDEWVKEKKGIKNASTVKSTNSDSKVDNISLNEIDEFIDKLDKYLKNNNNNDIDDTVEKDILSRKMQKVRETQKKLEDLKKALSSEDIQTNEKPQEESGYDPEFEKAINKFIKELIKE